MARIIAKNVRVEFPVVGVDRSFRKEILGESIGGLFRKDKSNKNRIKAVTAISDLNIELSNGDRLGLIGHNGAGKTTMLRLLLGNYWPTQGELIIDGRCMPLLVLGTGMDPDFSGYENIFLSGAMMGISRQELEENFDDICAFTELGDYLKLPIRTYSAGMLLRLGFAVITSTTPDILLVDEIFGAGDASFNQKAQARMNNTLDRANILVFASHVYDLIRQQCNKVCVMHKGASIYVGDTEDAIAFYEKKVLKH